MNSAADILATWEATGSKLSMADDLRCAAMECQELDVPRADYIAACVAAGYNKGTAARCWAYVAKQEL